MNLFSVGERTTYQNELGHWVAYWCWGSDEAVQFWKDTYEYRCDLPEAEYTVELVDRDKAHSFGGPYEDYPHREVRDEVLREIGWHCEDDSSCDSCGLYEMDGAFPVCEDCMQCSVCGCECEDEDEDEE